MARLTKLQRAVSLLFWLAVWQLAASKLHLSFALPTVDETFRAFVHLITEPAAWHTILFSLSRILLGLALGVACAIPLTWCTVSSSWANALIAPMMTVIRCTPVASFIMLLWVLLGRDALPQAIALLIVMPVMWQALTEGCTQLDHSLNEVLTVFQCGTLKRFRLLVVPGLRLPFFTALSTAAGLAWKSGVAAEIIAYTTSSIGRQIADARNSFDGPRMMAWTLSVVLLSLLIDHLIRIPAKWLRRKELPHA